MVIGIFVLILKLNKFTKENLFINSNHKVVVSPLITPSISVMLSPSVTPSVSMTPSNDAVSEASNEESDTPEDTPSSNSSNDKTDPWKLEPIDKNYKNFFKNDLFIGDSITDGMSAYEYIDEANVCGKLGLSLLSAKGQVDKAKIDNPKNIFILIGMNDLCEVSLGSEKYVNQYLEFIHYLKNKYPSSNIYVQSILPIASKAADEYPYLNNERINEFNNALKTMTVQENIQYLDINLLINSDTAYLYEQDGEHFKGQFYPVWLNYIENNISQ